MLTSIRGVLAATLLAGTALAATPAFAEEETAPPSDFTITGNAALVTDYRFRGLSQTSGDPAIQGGITVTHSSGFYLAAWASLLDFKVLDAPFAPFTPYSDVYGNMELDIYGGWSGPLGGGITADVGLLYYAYPTGDVGKAEFFEPYASVSATVGPVTGKLGVAYAWKQESLDFNLDGDDDDNLYVFFDLSGGIPDTPVSLAAHVGYTKGALTPKFATGQTLDYAGGWDWSIGGTFNITKNLSVGATYVGVDGATIDGYSDDTVVGTLKLSF